MKKKKNNVPLILFLVVAFGGVLYLFLAKTASNTVYFYTVQEVLGADKMPNKAVRVAGHVVAGSIVKEPETMTTRFSVYDKSSTGTTLQVVYQGPVPDIFKDEVEVVIEGRLKGHTFTATNLMAKCPSKYQQSGSPEDFKGIGGHPANLPLQAT